MMSQKTSQETPAAEFKPYVQPDRKIPEFTLQAILLGFLLSIVFNAANAYLGLKIGMTVTASIPSAIISMGVLRMLLPKLLRRDGTILENNIVHAFASNGETLAAGVIFTIPALLFLGSGISNTTVFLLGTAGGILGLLMMIPLRQSLMVKEHGSLPFPEGTACADVLIAGDRGGASAAPVFWGILTGGAFKFAMSGLKLFKDVFMWSWPSLNKAGFGYELSPLLVGVGYLVGLRIAALLFAGGLLGYWVLIPLIHAMGGHNVIFPGTLPIDEMTTAQLRSTYIRYIGAGGMAFGGVLSLAKSLPDIIASLRQSLGSLRQARQEGARRGPSERDWEQGPIVAGGALLGLLVGAFGWELPWRVGSEAWSPALRLAAGVAAHALLGGGLGAALGALFFFYLSRASASYGRHVPRDQRDLPLPLVGLGIVLMFLMLWLVPTFHLSFLEAAIVLLFSFFFVAVSARMVGLIGTTNQPVSGMTITALLMLALLFSVLGHDPGTLKTAAIMGGAIVCIAISVSGDLSQDLKTAALIGATPWKVESAQIMATLLSAVRSGFILLLLYKAYGFGAPTPEHPHPLEAPQSQLMANLVEGVTSGKLPWTLLGLGAGIGLVAEMCGISALALSLGLYIPVTNWPMIFLGGLLAWYASKKRGDQQQEEDNPGTLYASGLIAGDALTGIALAGITVLGFDHAIALRDPDAGVALLEGLLSAGLYAAVVLVLYRYASSRAKRA